MRQRTNVHAISFEPEERISEKISEVHYTVHRLILYKTIMKYYMYIRSNEIGY